MSDPAQAGDSRLLTGTTARSGFSGTVVALAALVGVFATTPGQTVGVSGFIDPIAADLGLSRDTVLVLYSIGTFLGILTAPTVGRLVDRFGPRRLVVPVVVALAGACAYMSVAWNAWSLGLGFVLLRASAIAGLSLVTSQMVNLWFDRFRGRITALAMMGLALGGLVVPPLAEAVTVNDGWRTAYLSLGAGVLALMLPVGVAFYRNKPEAHGAIRDFGRPRPASTGNTADGPTLGEATRTVDFWYLAALTLLVNAVNTALLLDHIRAMGAAGLDRGAAIALLGAVTVSQAAMTLVAGILVDRFGARPVGLLGLAVLAFSVVSVMTGLGGGLAYAVALGAMIATLQVAHSAGLAEAFGTTHLGAIRGTTFVVGVSGAALGPLPLVWSPLAAYSVFLALTAAGLALGWASLQRCKA
jgi:MFS family permease